MLRSSPVKPKSPQRPLPLLHPARTPISVRLDPAERRKLKLAATRAGTTICRYLRMAALRDAILSAAPNPATPKPR